MKLKDRFSHKSLKNEVADYLKEQIFLENYVGGDRIVETNVADQLDVSRAPVREAIKELESQGLVETVPRKGTFVVEFNQDEIQELFDIRVMLEERVFKILIKERLLTEDDFDYLEELVNEMVQISQSNKDKNEKIVLVNKRDMKFHSYLWKKSNSKWTNKILTTLYYQLQLAMIIDAKKEDNLKEASLKHKDIIRCLKEHSVKKTKQAVIDHIRTLSEMV
ncbi:MAG: GntR family transcriptional regulator [Halanaerobiales bacterium]|nr:GntR family transcriptional regulator [Halanaerobiales bacterium]